MESVSFWPFFIFILLGAMGPLLLFLVTFIDNNFRGWIRSFLEVIGLACALCFMGSFLAGFALMIDLFSTGSLHVKFAFLPGFFESVLNRYLAWVLITIGQAINFYFTMFGLGEIKDLLSGIKDRMEKAASS